MIMPVRREAFSCLYPTDSLRIMTGSAVISRRVTGQRHNSMSDWQNAAELGRNVDGPRRWKYGKDFSRNSRE